MDANQIGWIALLLALLMTLYLLIHIWRGSTRNFEHRGFFESVGGETIQRKQRPLQFWLMIAVRSMGAIGLWLLWYASWYVI